MLEKGHLSSSEPIIRVGIILPEDNQKVLTIHIPEEKNYRVVINKKSTVASNMDLKTVSNGIKWGDSVVKKILIQRRKDVQSIDHPLILKPVIIGRGFHWQKSIEVKLLGNLKITSLNGKLTVVNELPLEQYLMCVATSEMSAACPSALLEAQTIAARSWVLANVGQKHTEPGIDVCNDDCCQRYHGTGKLTEQSIESVQSSRGKVLLYVDKICDARYSKSCGGMTETFENVWGGDPIPYLPNVLDMPDRTGGKDPHLANETRVKKWITDVPNSFCSPAYVPEESLRTYLGSVDEDGHYFRWTVRYSQSEFTDLLNLKLDLKAVIIQNIRQLQRGNSGRLRQILIKYVNKDGMLKSIKINSEYEIRRVLHPGFLYSSAIIFDYKYIDDNIPEQIIIRGAGWGHGVGMCQIGALGMALKGYNTEEILVHYYPKTTLKKIYD